MTALWGISFSGAVLIGVIALVRFVLQKHVSRSVFLFLWMLAVLRLLLPFSLPAQTSIYNLPLFRQEQDLSAVSAGIEADADPMESISAPLLQQGAPRGAEEAQEVPPLGTGQLLFFIWISVFAVLYLSILLRHLLKKRSYRFSLPLPEMPAHTQGLRIRMLDGLHAPLTYGVFKPTVLLPVHYPEDPEQLRHILLHEKAHIQCHDILKKHLFLLTACIHWFNPLVWLMVYLAFEDMEIRCDAKAVQQLGAENKLSYARTLVSAETARLTDILQTGFSFSTTARRLQALKKLRHRPVISTVICLVLTAVLTLCFLTGPKAAASAQELPLVLPAAQTVEKDPPRASSDSDTEPLFTQAVEPLQETTQNEENSFAETEPAQGETEADANDSQTQGAAGLQAVAFSRAGITAWPKTLLQVGEKTECSLELEGYAEFFTDRPDVIRLTNFAVPPFYSPPYTYLWRHSLSITAYSTGKANIYMQVEGTTYFLFSIEVEAYGTVASVAFWEDMPSQDDWQESEDQEVLPSLQIDPESPNGGIGNMIGGNEP